MYRFLGIIGTTLMVLWDIVEFLAAPALFIVIGVLNGFPWQYYAIAIGGYVALFILIEVIAHFIFKALNKKHTPLIERKLAKFCDRFSKKE